MKTSTWRVIIPLVILVLAGIGFVAKTGFGSLSAIVWQDIAILCPLGALGTMLASKTVVPRVVISLVIALVGIVLLGRVFCGWICPVPVWKKFGDLFRKKDTKAASAAGANKGEVGEGGEGGESAVALAEGEAEAEVEAQPATPSPLTDKEK